MLAAIQVEITGGEWWEPFLVPLAVVLAGMLAALFSWWITRRTFAHERGMRERAASREALDALVGEITNATRTLTDSAEVLSRFSQMRYFEMEEETVQSIARESLTEEMRSAIRKLKASHISLMTAGFRLHIRFPDSSRLVATFAAWRASYDELAELYGQAIRADTPSGQEEAFARLKRPEEQHERLGRELREFLSAAREWSDPPDKGRAVS